MSSQRHFFNLHGLQVSLELNYQPFGDELDRALSVFARPESSALPAAQGAIRAFDAAEVSRSVSPQAMAIAGLDDLIELYCLDERYWLVDDRWGICEVNLLKRQWRSWILPYPKLDPMGCVDTAVHWPMAQLLHMRGVDLIPAISLENNGFGVLIIAPYGIGPELACLLGSGYRVIGQRWTALTRQGQRVVMHHFPGAVQMPLPPGQCSSFGSVPQWHDLAAEHPAQTASSAWCQAVFIIEPGRRSVTRGREIARSATAARLRHAWPIIELPLNRKRIGDFAAILAANCQCISVELGRGGDDLVRLMEAVRLRRVMPKVQVKLNRLALARASMNHPASIRKTG